MKFNLLIVFVVLSLESCLGQTDKLISNWNRQNPAIDKLLNMLGQQMDKNRQFLLGRNLLPASGYAFSTSNFFESLSERLKPYSITRENHPKRYAF
ncbi:hypothetical protein J2W55_002327 [Mucilaginibacter pocheonensis]|uniref:Uncharacterized protein n=1 Tax=Mucilaginibacter pocheonensis TaxID=398050 RepID=A0ABU1TBB6_9SPHI|nr:hypothetical protein [Mucilaginibacter pocheonensis]